MDISNYSIGNGTLDRSNFDLLLSGVSEKKYPPHLVVMQNRMINAYHSMSVNEKKIFILLSPKVRFCKEPNQDTVFHITAQEFASKTNIAVNSAYEALKDISKKLSTRKISYQNLAGNRVNAVWMIRCEYESNCSRIGLQLSYEAILMLKLFNKSHPYTIMREDESLKLGKQYSLEFFQMFSQYLNLGWRSFTLDEIKEKFELVDKYNQPSCLIRKVILPSLDEINEKTGLLIEYEIQRMGRIIKGIRFKIQQKNPIKANHETTVTPIMIIKEMSRRQIFSFSNQLASVTALSDLSKVGWSVDDFADYIYSQLDQPDDVKPEILERYVQALNDLEFDMQPIVEKIKKKSQSGIVIEHE